MKERIIEDWLNRINERGYQAAFGQILAAAGAKVLRISHSPYEHGKDVVSIASAKKVNAYQLKDGNIGLKEWEKGFQQVCALVETRPVHPSLPIGYKYFPWLVTNGLFSDPVLDRIEQHNKSWEQRGLPKLGIIDGRWIHRELSALSLDFWPIDLPNIRVFRKLYLVDGRGDFDSEVFSNFARFMLNDDYSQKVLERRVAALNIFCSYILGEFYRQDDHWSVFRAWTIVAATISSAYETLGKKSDLIRASFVLARDAAEDALASLSRECQNADAFVPVRLEWDEYTRVRNAVALGAWAGWCLLNSDDVKSGDACASTLSKFLSEGRIAFWGEGAFPFICAMAWFLEQRGEVEQSEKLFIDWMVIVINRQHRHSEDPLPDPYVSPEEVLEQMVERILKNELIRKKSIQSYCLFPLVLILVRRGRLDALSEAWKKISHVSMTIFEHESAAGYLEWRCKKGAERDFIFMQPQSYGELDDLASKPPIWKLPSVLREDTRFKMMFFLTFSHRLAWSIVGSLDHEFLKEGDSE